MSSILYNTLHITRVFFNVKLCILQLNLQIKEFISVLLLSNIILQTELIIHSEKDHDVRCAPTPPVLQHIHKNEENHRKKSCVVNFNFYSSNILCRQLHDI